MKASHVRSEQEASWVMQFQQNGSVIVDLPVQASVDIAIVGFDDVKYAKLLGTPLTTMRQPCDEIGTAAINAMLQRISNPSIPARTIMVQASLIVRKSCGISTEKNT